jgi:hypothetical protein
VTLRSREGEVTAYILLHHRVIQNLLSFEHTEVKSKVESYSENCFENYFENYFDYLVRSVSVIRID